MENDEIYKKLFEQFLSGDSSQWESDHFPKALFLLDFHRLVDTLEECNKLLQKVLLNRPP